MRYTWPKRKLCRREKKNLFWPKKYDIWKSDNVPGQHWAWMKRLSEYWLLLRNKQAFKRSYALTEKQFSTLVNKTSKTYSKNKWISHDVSVLQFLERRCDVVLLRAWYASTIMQARQMMVHWHWLLNWSKHNIPSHFVKVWDVLSVRQNLQWSSLYEQSATKEMPVHLKVDKNKFSIEMLQFPQVDPANIDADVLKVIEFYARA